jgi:hypothetical protein
MQTVALGFNVYLWGEESQNRFLSECIAPAVGSLCRDGVLERFWYDRMGTRGPHLFILIAVQSSLAPRFDGQLRSLITGYLEERPSTETLTTDEVLHIHEDMSGKVFCRPDMLEMLAENNTFLAFKQAEEEYPFGLIDDATYGCELWQSITNLYLWSLRCLQNCSAAALSKIASTFALLFNEVCFQDDAIAVDYWKYHSETLLLGLDRAPLDDETLAHVLPRLIGSKNLSWLKSFGEMSNDRQASILNLTSEAGESLQTMKRYISMASEQYSQPLPRAAKIVIREILHTFLKQLGLNVPQHIPIVLFLWLMNFEATHRIEPATA